MPQEPVIVYSVETGQPAFMHSVDADEATRGLGGYTFAVPAWAHAADGQETAEYVAARTQALARFVRGEGAPDPLPPPIVEEAPEAVASPRRAPRILAQE